MAIVQKDWSINMSTGDVKYNGKVSDKAVTISEMYDFIQGSLRDTSTEFKKCKKRTPPWLEGK